jgi:hypothetical protein
MFPRLEGRLAGYIELAEFVCHPVSTTRDMPDEGQQQQPDVLEDSLGEALMPKPYTKK